MENLELEKVINEIPVLEEYFNIDMTLESFVKKDLPKYFNIKKKYYF